MKRSRNPIGVTWAPDLRLAQVKLFSIYDFPSRVGKQPEYHLNQKRVSGILGKPITQESIELPPGFDCTHLGIPKIQWKCPPKFGLNLEWEVAAGEKSLQTKVQKYREMSLFEAVYPRVSDIPSNPSITLDVESEQYDDSCTPIIPLIPIEEATAALETVSSVPGQLSDPPFGCQPSPVVHELSQFGNHLSSVANNLSGDPPTLGVELPHSEPDVTTATSPAVAAINNIMEQGSSIDPELLVKILNDSDMIRKLIEDTKTPKNMGNPPNQPRVSAAAPRGNPILLQAPTKEQPTMINRAPTHPDFTPIHRPNTSVATPPIDVPSQDPVKVPVSRSVGGHHYPTPNQAPLPFGNVTEPQISSHLVPPTMGFRPSEPNSKFSTPMAPTGTNNVKNLDYFKKLIREHGADMHKTQDQGVPKNATANYRDPFYTGGQLRERNTKFWKPCMYFRSSRGCVSGSSCPYQHDLSFQLQTGYAMEVPCAKRMKYGGEVSWRT